MSVYDGAAMRSADAIAIMFAVTDHPNAARGAETRSASYTVIGVLCVRTLVNLQPLSGTSRAGF
jgi:hypothetical protein